MAYNKQTWADTSAGGTPIDAERLQHIEDGLEVAARASLTRVTVKTANYNAAPGDLVPVDTTAGSVIVTLPNAPAQGTWVGVKHVVVGAGNTVTVAAAGADVFNVAGGVTSRTLPLASQAVILHYSAGVWTVIADDIPLASIDSRYATFVIHGATAGTARPTGVGLVIWIGTVVPTNAVTGDLWVDTNNKLFKRYNGASWDTLAPVSLALEPTTPPPDTNVTGGVLGGSGTAAHSDHGHRIGDHDHSASGKGAKLAQANTHQTADTDAAAGSLHHTIGGGATQAAAGNHTHTKTYRISKSYTIAGAISAATLPVDFIPVPAGQTVTLVKVRTVLGAGTATVAVQKAGVALSGLGALSVTTTATTVTATGTGSDNVFADEQGWRAVISAPASATDLSVTAYFDITV